MPGRLAAPRIVATALASMLLSSRGFVVGTVVGWQSAGSLMGLSSDMYFLMFCRMIWFRDVIGMIVKGLRFGLVPAAICCFEALRLVGISAGETSSVTAAGEWFWVERPGGADRTCSLPVNDVDLTFEHDVVHVGI